MANLHYNSSSKTIFVLVDSSAGYGMPYEIEGSEGSYKSGTTSSGGVSTNTNWKPSYSNETLTLYINNAYKGDWCWDGSSLTAGECAGSVEGCIIYDDIELVSSSYSNGVVTVKLKIYYYNDGDTTDRATIYYQIGGNGYFSQTVSLSGWDYDYITCNMTIMTGALSSTSYTFNVNGYVDSNNCGNDHFSQNLTATWDNTRPDKFYWISSSSSLRPDQKISDYITAAKWKELQTNVNAVRVYKGLSKFSFTTYSRGQTITADAYNQIVNAINAMKSGAVSTVSKGQTITASVMMALQNGINGIS